jgi:hypothetical protein
MTSWLAKIADELERKLAWRTSGSFGRGLLRGGRPPTKLLDL